MEWRPIETAPKDGSAIIIAHKFWRKSGIAKYRYGDGWCHYDDMSKISHQDQITHWMPLPDPPT